MGEGFKMLCKLYGRLNIAGVEYAWDYVNEVVVPHAQMPFGSERHAASERARAEILRKSLHGISLSDPIKDRGDDEENQRS